jgi:hypothetical protein
MTHGMDPGCMAPAERMDEVGMLLSLAMMRLWRRRRGSALVQRDGSRNSSQEGRDCLELSRPMNPDGLDQ